MLAQSTVDIESQLELFFEYKRNPSKKLRDKLVVMNLQLARKIAHQVARTSHVPYEELQQEAFEALIRSVERFDPSQGFRFSTFAVPLIKGRVLNYLRDKSFLVKIPRSHFGTTRKVKTIENANQGLSTKELAQKAGIDWHQYVEASSAFIRCHYTVDLTENSAIAIEIEDRDSSDRITSEIDCSSLSPTEFNLIKLFFLQKKSLAQIAIASGLGKDAIKKALRTSLLKISPQFLQPA